MKRICLSPSALLFRMKVNIFPKTIQNEKSLMIKIDWSVFTIRTYCGCNDKAFPNEEEDDATHSKTDYEVAV